MQILKKLFPGKSSKKSGNAPAPASAAKPLGKTTGKGGLPLIGHLPVAQQLRALLSVLGVALLTAAALVYVQNREAAQNATYVSTATEMQMLSQRIANSVQQAAQGVPASFPQLKQSQEQFIANLNLLENGGQKLGVEVPPSPDGVRPVLQDLRKQWGPVNKNITLVLAQQQNLIDLKKNEDAIRSTTPRLALLANDLAVSANDSRESYTAKTYALQLQADVTNFDFINALRLLSTDTPNPQVALQLRVNTREFQETLNALLGNGNKNGISIALTSSRTKQKAADLNKQFAPFATSVNSIVGNMAALASAKQASRDIFAVSENLLKLPVQMTEFYQQESTRQIYFVAGAVLFALLALASLFLLGKVFLDDARRRALESEQENRRNQEAILRLLDEMGNVADGDLTVQATVTEDVTGAIADSINYTIEQLRGLVSGITRAADQVTGATSNAQKIATQLLAATQKQSTEIQTTGQAVLQIAHSIGEVSENATQSAQVARSSLTAAEKGAQAVQNAIQGMNDIRDQIQETSKRIKRLGESSQEIGEIVQLITDITEQTNVLALNAAIQAASAGEAGRGFAVVAEEVQRLAERSAEATKHISAIVKSIQLDTQGTVEAMEKSTQGVVEGARVADEAGQALHEIEQVSTRLAELIGAISNATQDQAKSATQVAANMKGILNITQMTTAGTQKTAQSATQLTALANELKSSVAGFKLS